MSSPSASNLSLLARQFPSSASVLSEIAMIQAKLTLPKRRIHIISDVHGDDRKLRHVVNNASGGLSNLIDEVFGYELTDEEKRTFLAFLYYPVEKMRRFHTRLQDREWRLRKIKSFSACNFASSATSPRRFPKQSS